MDDHTTGPGDDDQPDWASSRSLGAWPGPVRCHLDRVGHLLPDERGDPHRHPRFDPAFLLGVPLIYALALLTQAPLLAFGLIPFSAYTYFASTALGAVAGCCWLALANAKATLKRLSEGGRENIHVAFWDGAALATPLAFVSALLVPVHAYRAAAVWIVIGTIAGMVAAAATSLFTALAGGEPEREGSLNFLVLEIGLVSLLPVALFAGIFGHSWQWLWLIIPAEIIVAVWSRRASLRRRLGA